MAKIYQLGIFQELDTVQPVEAESEKQAREKLLKMIERGEIYVIDDPAVETHIERVKIKEDFA